jgi:hypothetical protein
MEKPAHTQFPIHELLAHRWIPRAFDERPIGGDLLRTLFEAASLGAFVQQRAAVAIRRSQ